MGQGRAKKEVVQLLAAMDRLLVASIFLLLLSSCASQAAREAELAAIEADRVAAEQEAARIAQQEQRQRAMEEQQRLEVEAADRARIALEQQRRETEARERAEAETRRLEEEQRREDERLAAVAAAESERQDKMESIAELERQIAAIEAGTVQDEATNAVLQEAILVAEELLEVLAAEQAKYENTDDLGNTIEPLAKELIADLEARKDNLVRRAQSQTQ